jgi:hypothetical protein
MSLQYCFRRGSLIIAGLVLLVTAPAVAQSTSGCRAADTKIVPRRLAYFRGLLTTTAPVRVAIRDTFGLSAVSASKINLVTKASTCVAAVNAMNAISQSVGKVRQVWVYTLGTNYAVEDPADQEPGQYRLIYLFTNSHVYKSTMAL